MQVISPKKTAMEYNSRNWNNILREFNNLKHTFINLYDPKKKVFVFANNCFDHLPTKPSTDIPGKGLDSWTNLILDSDLKKAGMLFLEPESDQIINYRNVQNKLYYRIKNPKGQPVCVAHEQRYIKSGQLYILNMITDVTEKVSAKRLIDKVNIELNPNDSEAIDKKHSIISGEISGREHEVLQLIATGLSSKEIADKLFISNHTAISHRKNLIEKFNVKNTAELIKEASRVLWLC